MKLKAIIPPEQRQNYRCHFCGTNQSVKYVTEIHDPIIDNNPTNVCVCNKCFALFGGKE